MSTPAVDQRTHAYIPAHIFMYGLTMWLIGSFEFFSWMGFVDPAIAKVGLATMAIAGPATIISHIRAVIEGAFSNSNWPA